MTRVTTRLRHLEERWRPRSTLSTIHVYWHGHLLPCPEHRRCGVEPETGIHHPGLVSLSFEAPRS